MTRRTFRDLLKAQPFVPFRVVMSSGQSYEVRHPEMAWLLAADLLIGIDVEDDGTPAHFRTCSLLHITTIEPLITQVASPN